jgi:hypothetical protein
MPFFFMGAGSAFFAGAVVVVVVVVVVFDVSTAGFIVSVIAGAGAAAGVCVSAGGAASFFAHAMSPRTATARNKRFIESPFNLEISISGTHTEVRAPPPPASTGAKATQTPNSVKG